MTIKHFYPEMGEQKPEADCEIWYSPYKWHRITTKYELPAGRSVKFSETLKSSDLNHYSQHKVGWHVYKATDNGVRILENKGFTFSCETLLS